MPAGLFAIPDSCESPPGISAASPGETVRDHDPTLTQ